jgi:hypothetical protein
MLAPKQRLFLCVLAIGLCVPAASGQWLETTIPLPDTMPELLYLSSLLYHPTNKTIYVGGADSFLFAVDARAGAKLARVKVGVGPHVLCSNVPGNKVYCANKFWTFNVIDGASNRAIKTLPIEHDVTDMVYVGPENKLYCGNATDTLLQVMDCAGDSVVARVRVNFGPGALCYNSLLNRIYCAHESSDVVTVVDCAADTVVAVIPTASRLLRFNHECSLHGERRQPDGIGDRLRRGHTGASRSGGTWTRRHHCRAYRQGLLHQLQRQQCLGDLRQRREGRVDRPVPTSTDPRPGEQEDLLRQCRRRVGLRYRCDH